MTPDTFEARLQDARDEMIFREEQLHAHSTGYYAGAHALALSEYGTCAHQGSYDRARSAYLALVAELNDRNAAEARLRELTNA